jgi:hypothetical protein
MTLGEVGHRLGRKALSEVATATPWEALSPGARWDSRINRRHPAFLT